MPETTKTFTTIKGSEWLIKECLPYNTFIPEDFDDEQLMIGDLCSRFLRAEIFPVADRIEKAEPGLMPNLIEKAGEQGLLATSFPIAYGGFGKDFVTATIVNEGLGGGGSFSVAVSAHTGISTLPILYFGTEDQKEKYIPKLISGEWKASYGLTEPNSGSDALGAKTTAVLSDDKKHYILNGQKCWITNGGFADVFIVFAKINGEQFTAFIVERGYNGFTMGQEEHKMGIKGSSTVQLFFDNCAIPVENVLGEIGKGHVIAFNILNIGRLRLNAAAIGAAKTAAATSIQYAKTRVQFKQPIVKFGAIKHKIAEMMIRIFVAESALYRTAKWIDEKEKTLSETGVQSNKAMLGAVEEFAVECSMLKVFGSELLDFVVDEGVQIHGGNGFSDEYVISRNYRDSRINRIFEGTNEINRLLIVDMILKRSLKGHIELMPAIVAISKELISIPSESIVDDNSPLTKEIKYIVNFKKAALTVAGAAIQKLTTRLNSEQEILMNISNMLIETFHAESALLRVLKLIERTGETANTLYIDMIKTYVYDAADRISKSGKDALNGFAQDDELRMMHLALKRFTKVEPFNTKEARRRIAEMF